MAATDRVAVRFVKPLKKAAAAARKGTNSEGRFLIKSRLNEAGLKLSPKKRSVAKKRRSDT
jgi:hypothetical protein